jgi:hypothetical protein
VTGASGKASPLQPDIITAAALAQAAQFVERVAAPDGPERLSTPERALAVTVAKQMTRATLTRRAVVYWWRLIQGR